ncbi:MAG: DUF1015 domain-containing protein [Clostridia bacterium]|nr:DUF1015 domain-containing protein [Clostridia bacterium]
MAVFKPFKAIRPIPEYAADVAALPYDVMNSAEAREMVQGNPYSFLHVDKAEVDLDESVDLYSDAVYAKAKENLCKLESDGICKQDEKPCFYIYRQTMNGRSQTGVVGCASIDDYLNNIIKKHELTRADKEADRIRHVDTCNANTGPIFLCYRENARLNEIIAAWKESHTPVYDFISTGDVGNTVWVVDDDALIAEMSALFGQTGCFYIADGHHRCASAVNVGQRRRKENPDFDGTEEFNFFLAVLFPQQELEIMDYNRVIADLNGNTSEQFMDKLGEVFDVEKAPVSPYKPTAKHTFGMLLDGQWYKLTTKPQYIDESDPVRQLDVSILQDYVISPILGIDDPRRDKRIDFIGGIRGLGELERRVSLDMRLAFSMFPTTMDDLFDIADSGAIMPPKSTWFEPKLLSGLFIHRLS